MRREGSEAVTSLGHLTELYHGLHPAAPQAECQRLEWRVHVPRTDRIRVRKHTCACRTVVYELCQAGGLAFVRELYREGAVTRQRESAWLLTAEGLHLWEAILSGCAR